MKKIFFLTVIFACSVIVAFGQGEIKVIGEKDEMQTLFGYESKITGYGALETKFTQLNGKESVLVGGHGGVIFNSYFYFGVGAYGLVTTQNIGLSATDEPLDMQMGYTGLMMAMNIMPKKVIHFSIPVFIGAGNIAIEKDDALLENSPFLLFEPSLQLEINVVRFMKVGFGGGYRLVQGTSLNSGIEDADLSAWTGNFSVVFGKFK